jgi:hypothetical protein
VQASDDVDAFAVDAVVDGVRKTTQEGPSQTHGDFGESHRKLPEQIDNFLECLDELVAEDVWAVYFGPVSLGWLHVQKRVILDHDGSSSRNPKL